VVLAPRVLYHSLVELYDMDGLFDFDLPSALIAQSPASPRDHARLLVYDRATGCIADDFFYNLCEFLPKETLVVANNSRVAHCRYLFDGGRTEIFAVESLNDHTVRAMVRPGKRFRLGDKIMLEGGVGAGVTAVDDNGLRTIVFDCALDDPRLVNASHVPLPPYIKQDDTLAAEYQTIYARRSGSLAAPTAGLHFTPELKQKVADEFGWAEVELEVGLGTFASLSDKNFASGSLHSEKYSVDPTEYDRIAAAPHVTAIGTTTLRTLESILRNKRASSKARPRNGDIGGMTDIFIRPGYEFARVDSLVTNFHLPSTSLLLLVEAFIGSRSELERIYLHAIAEKYRFYSFGDAMLII
jgi:S-adenosylmethionine:tRNA ribosyltransferase-isomerase